jgi:mRNA interferase RelE/StbE
MELRGRLLLNWTIEIKPTAEKQYLRLDKTTRVRVKKALINLEQCDNPLFHSNVKPLVGELRGDYRYRFGGYRILFTPDKINKVIYVYAILPRGDVYKK